jgi:hypothetical protein
MLCLCKCDNKGHFAFDNGASVQLITFERQCTTISNKFALHVLGRYADDIVSDLLLCALTQHVIFEACGDTLKHISVFPIRI